MRNSNKIKVHICGDGLAGKTTLCKTLQRNRIQEWFHFKPNETDDPNERTRGIEITNIELNNHEFTLWDYGGQEEFHISHDDFINSSQISLFLIVLNILKKIEMKN